MEKAKRFVEACVAKDARNLELLTELRGWLLELPIPQTDKKVLQFIWSKTVRFNKPMEWMKHGDYKRPTAAAFAAPTLDGMGRQSLWRARNRLKAMGLIAESYPPRPSDERVLTAPNWEYLSAYLLTRVHEAAKFEEIFRQFQSLVSQQSLEFKEIDMKLEEVLDKAGEYRVKARKLREARRRKKKQEDLKPADLMEEILDNTEWGERRTGKMRGQMRDWIKECHEYDRGNPLDLIKKVIKAWGRFQSHGWPNKFGGMNKPRTPFKWETFYASREYILPVLDNMVKGIEDEEKTPVIDLRGD
jgi:hypothetical protein